MLAFSTEHGPYNLPDGETQFVKNEHSWNKEANVLYIEQPAGVGFSTCDNLVHPESCVQSDEQSAKDNLQFVLMWLTKFPEYINNDLYISGESYAGIYTPYLAN